MFNMGGVVFNISMCWGVSNSCQKFAEPETEPCFSHLIATALLNGLPYKFYVLGQIGLSKQCRPSQTASEEAV